MNHSLERIWVAWLNSNRWRQFAGRGAGASLFNSPVYHRLNIARRFMTTQYQSWRQPTLFDDVRTVCLFIGQVKSGGTLLGSLLDAHPDVILADEADVLRYAAAGFSRNQIFHLLLKGSRREALKGRVTARRLTAYSFDVPGQWQGRYRQLHVIGDSKAGPTTRRLAQQPDLLANLQQLMHGVELKFIQVIRNPFDPISAMMLRGKRTFANAIDHYFDYCATLHQLRQQLSETNLMALRYEAFIRQPQENLGNLCHFLGLEADEAYLDACAHILDATPQQLRHQIAWTPEWQTAVHQKIAQFDFLTGYHFEN